MLNKEIATKMATAWVDAWNQRAIDNIMSHYADDVIFYSPTVAKRWGLSECKLSGKRSLKKHFLFGLQLMPELHFKLIDVLIGSDGYTIIYKRETGKLVVDVITTNDEHKGKVVRAYYS